MESDYSTDWSKFDKIFNEARRSRGGLQYQECHSAFIAIIILHHAHEIGNIVLIAPNYVLPAPEKKTLTLYSRNVD